MSLFTLPGTRKRLKYPSLLSEKLYARPALVRAALLGSRAISKLLVDSTLYNPSMSWWTAYSSRSTIEPRMRRPSLVHAWFDERKKEGCEGRKDARGNKKPTSRTQDDAELRPWRVETLRTYLEPLPDQSAVRREWTGGGWGEPATVMYSSSGREVALLATLSRANAPLNPSD
jgi:hypothetical protein